MPWHEWLLIGVLAVVVIYAACKGLLALIASGDR